MMEVMKHGSDGHGRGGGHVMVMGWWRYSEEGRTRNGDGHAMVVIAW